jgi:Zn-dependent protease with chaperone function
MLPVLVIVMTLAAAPHSATIGSARVDSASAVLADTAAVAHANPSAASRDYLAEMRAGFTAQNRTYWRTQVVLAFVGPLLSILVAALILFSGLAAKLRDIATVLSRFGWVRLLVFFTLYTLIVYVVTFPLEWYQGYALEHYYGLSTQSFAAWIADEGKELLVSVVLLAVVPILWLAYRAIEKSPRRWWLWFAFATLPLVLGIALIEPLVIDPLFNKFTPLRDQQLKAKIIALAERAEIPGRKVYEVDKSKQTKTLNAYVNGFGVSQRIVLWDTTLHAMSDDEILYVMGHEMGHYKLAHIWKGIALSALGSFALLWIAARIARWAVRRFGDAWGFHELHDIASLPLLLAILLGLNFVSQPISNAVSRRIETEADVFGLEITHDNDAAARAFLKLGAQNKSNPDPPAWIRLTLYTHPTLADRVRLALEYRPWEQGKPNRFFHGK